MSLSAVIPLKVSGRHYGDNLARLDLLFSSLLHFAPGLLDDLIVVVPDDEADSAARHLAGWRELPLRIVLEGEHFPAFRRFRRPWQIRPWQRQQVIKLNAPAITSSSFVLTLDPDVLAVRAITRGLLLPEGRALLAPEARHIHARWWRDSADLLGVEPALQGPGMSVTPAVLSTAVLSEVQRRLEEIGGRPWMEVLLTSYCDWTEYTLYLLAADRASMVDRHHIWSDDPAAPARLHVDPNLSIWGAEGASSDDLDRLFRSDDPGLFAVVQSSSGLPASEVGAAVARRLPVRHPDPGPPLEVRGSSKLQERVRVASRLTAQGIYRGRRELRRMRARAAQR
jgi:Family of unknown function (DUF6492)